MMETHDILCHAPTDGLGKDEVDHKLVLGVESRPEPSWLQELFLLKSNLEVRRARSHRAFGVVGSILAENAGCCLRMLPIPPNTSLETAASCICTAST